MDPLKKLVADRLKAPIAGPHPDAEVLSAFAEHALPASERESVLQHLSTCSDCRDIIFLAAPPPAESQEVVSVPKRRPVFGLRWGTLAACIVIAAVFLVSRHQAPRTEQLAKSLPQSTSPAATDTIVAAEKTPAGLTEMRDKLPAPVHAPANTGHAEPKHITAKPEGNMSFADSGEVSVNAPAAVDAKMEPRPVPSLPILGRNVANLKQISPGATPAAAGAAPAATGTGVGVSGGATGGVNGLAVGGPTRASNYPYNANSADLTAKKLDALHGSVSGTIVDASGAVIPNAKVTALGPFGTTTVISDQAGKYGLDQLAVGNYVLKFDAPGFQEKQLRQVAVLADKPANFDVKLFPGATTETVEVAAAEPIVQQQQASLQNERQQQSENQIQAEDLEVEARAIKVQKAARSKDKSRVLRQVGAAQSLTVPAWQWSVSPQGAVQRSSDLGKTWQPVTVNQNAIFRAISAFGPDVWVGGNLGALYHSTDSGLHWTQVIPSAGTEKLLSDITQVQWLHSEHRLIVTTSTSEVWTTADGGQTWARR